VQATKSKGKIFLDMLDSAQPWELVDGSNAARGPTLPNKRNGADALHVG
jgi:hypothetical protein